MAVSHRSRSRFAALLSAGVLGWSCAGSRAPLADNPPPPPAPEVKAASAPSAAPPDIALFDYEEQRLDRERQLAEIELEALREPPPLGDTDQPAVDPEEMALLDELTEAAMPEEVPAALSDEERLRQTPSEMPLVLNDQVQRLINYFTQTRRGKETMRASLGRGSAYRGMIDRILEEEDVPAELFYLAMAESGFRPKARSYARATGMWQFMSSRGKQYGLKQDRYVDLRYAVERATRASAKHLKDLHIEFEDWHLAMAAYNCGPNRVKRAIARAGSRDYWELSRRRLLPSQTRNYVPIILAMTYVGKNLDLFDIGEIDAAPPRDVDMVGTASEISFALIADIAGISTEAVKDLNPALLRSATPPYDYDLILPSGSRKRFLQEIALVPADKRLNWRRYSVKSGETLAAVAKRFGVKAEALAELNAIDPGAALDGLALTVPTTTRLASYRYYGGGRAGGLLEAGTGRYRIARGDTLGGIAQRFGTSVAQLRAWNNLASTRIRAGRYLIVRPEGAGAPASAQASSGAAPAGSYRVRRGDTLSGIAGRYRVSVAQLKSWNGLRSSTIRIGQTLKVPQRGSPAPARTASASLPARSQPPPGNGQYRIRSGDSLIVIAQRFGVTVNDLRQWNNMRGSRITAGKYLIVRPPSSRSAARASAASSAPKPAPQSAPPKSQTPASYTVRSGDTLGHIAERFGVRAGDLRAWNGIRGSRINVGQKLVVRAPGASGGRYKIRRGDTLDVIARRFDVSVAELKQWNGLRSSRIVAGDYLIVKRSGS